MGHTAVERLSFNFMDNKQRADKLINHAKAPEMASFEELLNINETLKEIKDKEHHAFPEMSVTDLKETNDLLQKLLDKEAEDIEITLTLE